MSTISPAKIINQRSYQVAGKLRITEHTFDVPLDPTNISQGRFGADKTLRIFGRSVRKQDTAIVPDKSKDKDQLPWMCYLQGGPGMSCRAPQNLAWTQTMVERGYEVFCLDQRGTGLSSPVTASTLQHVHGNDAEAQAAYLRLFRADSIVRDCEAIRLALTADYPPEKKKWSIMGQSFGGFCSITYLSYHPEGLRESFIFGGLQPLVSGPDQVYSALYQKVAQRNEAYYTKFPEDAERVKAIMTYLDKKAPEHQDENNVEDGAADYYGEGSVTLRSSGALTCRRLRQRIMFGFHGGLDTIHDIILQATTDLEMFDHLTRPTLSAIENILSFDDHLIYAILHEPIYCSSASFKDHSTDMDDDSPSPAWSAHRLLDHDPAFSPSSNPIYFTGETVYPWMFTDYAALRPVRKAAELIAHTPASEWPALFDLKQLAQNTVPVYAAAYVEDMYVDFDLSMQTAKAIKGCKVFSTNVMFHDAIRSKVDEVVRQLFALRDDVVD